MRRSGPLFRAITYGVVNLIGLVIFLKLFAHELPGGLWILLVNLSWNASQKYQSLTPEHIEAVIRAIFT